MLINLARYAEVERIGMELLASRTAEIDSNRRVGVVSQVFRAMRLHGRVQQAEQLARKYDDEASKVRGTWDYANFNEEFAAVLLRRAEYPEAERRALEAHRYYVTEASILDQSNVLRELGHIALERGDLQLARERLTQVAKLSRSVNEKFGLVSAELGLVDCDLRDGLLDAARERLSNLDALVETIGEGTARLWTALFAAELAALQGASGDNAATARRVVADLEAREENAEALDARAIEARILARSGRTSEARVAAMELRKRARECGDRLCEDEADRILGTLSAGASISP